MSFTQATLETAIKEYLDSTETTFTNNLSNFIKSTEERILKSVDLPVFRKNVTGTATSGTAYLGSPSDFLSPFSLAVISSGNGDNYSYLWFKHVTFIRDYERDECHVVRFFNGGRYLFEDAAPRTTVV
mgnify:CR=1 FL=1